VEQIPLWAAPLFSHVPRGTWMAHSTLLGISTKHFIPPSNSFPKASHHQHESRPDPPASHHIRCDLLPDNQDRTKMAPPDAFIGKAIQPTAIENSAAPGPPSELWKQLLERNHSCYIPEPNFRAMVSCGSKPIRLQKLPAIWAPLALLIWELRSTRALAAIPAPVLLPHGASHTRKYGSRREC